MTDWTNPSDIGRKGSNLELWNTYLRDNMTHIKAPPTDLFNATYVGGGADPTSSSASFVDVSSDFNLTLTSYGGDILCCFRAHAIGTGYFDISFDNSRVGGDDGIIAIAGNAPVSLFWLIQDAVAGEHTFHLQWKTGTSLALGTSYPAQFWVREFS